MQEKLIKKYAYTLARVGLNVKKNQTVLVEADIEGHYFVPYFVEECYKLGADKVIVSYLDTPTLIKQASYEKDFENPDTDEEKRYQKHLDNGACYIRLEGVNPLAMKDVPENISSIVFSHIDNTRNIMRKAAREKHCQWCIGMIPTAKWADYIIKQGEDKLETLWNTLLKLCYISEDNDIVKTWKELNRQRNKRAQSIDKLNLTTLHYKSKNGTDLTLKLTPYSRFAHDTGESEFNANIPTEEIYTTPEKYGSEGVVYATKPLVLGGKAIENFGFRFHEGKVVEVLADEGKEMLVNLVNSDENAGYLGECALVEYHSPISMSGLVYYTTLIDENASCHLALGRGLGICPDPNYTFNDSKIHIDFMIGNSDLTITGTTAEGKEILIFKEGDFNNELF